MTQISKRQARKEELARKLDAGQISQAEYDRQYGRIMTKGKPSRARQKAAKAAKRVEEWSPSEPAKHGDNREAIRVTLDHPASQFGMPVVLTDDGQPMDAREGVRAIRRLLGVNVSTLAGKCGVSPRTVEDWEQGRRPPNAANLNMLGLLLAAHQSGEVKSEEPQARAKTRTKAGPTHGA